MFSTKTKMAATIGIIGFANIVWMPLLKEYTIIPVAIGFLGFGSMLIFIIWED